MKRPTSPLAAGIAALVAGTALLGSAQPAAAATVLNRFERSCYVTCSAFIQVNGPYVASVGSNCVTKSWFGNTTSYTLPAGRRC